MPMGTPRLAVIAAVLLLTALTAHAAQAPGNNVQPPSDTCRRYLMRADHLRQLYAGGARMRVRVPTVPELLKGLTTVRVYEAAWRKLSANGLHDADARQWLDINLSVGPRQYGVILSLRRWTADLGYGLPGEITVWGLGGGGTHEGSAERVIHRLLQHVDQFVALYVQAQTICRR